MAVATEPSFWTQFWPLLVSTAAGGLIVLVATGIVKLARDRSAVRSDASSDFRGMAEFFFGRPANRRTGTPSAPGWTELVNSRFDRLEVKLDRVLGQVEPDGNGGHNMRGKVDKVANAVLDDP